MMITAMISPFFVADIIYSFINYLHTNVTRVPPPPTSHSPTLHTYLSIYLPEVQLKVTMQALGTGTPPAAAASS